MFYKASFFTSYQNINGSEIETSRVEYCATLYSESIVNQMWILKNSKELLGNFKS